MTKSMDSLSELNKDKKREAALIKRYGSLENYRQVAKEWGRAGGKKTTGGGFRDPEVASRAGKLGVIAMRKKIEQEIRNEIKEELGDV